MLKKIAILGSTGSIGKSLLKIINKDKKNFAITLLSARKNYKELLKQAKTFNVKNVILTDKKFFELYKSKFIKEKINIFNDYNSLKKIINSKLDYVMSSIVGLDGLIPTIEIIKYTKKIAIANKETIICAWSLIQKELNKSRTQFIPVDSEHFSIWYALNHNSKLNIKKIYLTASGGPLLNISNKKVNKLPIEKIIKHPTWKMGKKISVDSSTMMNKVYEIIEAKKIFNIPYNKISILIHPKSYIHAIVQFNDGMTKIIAHETTMEIPIFNTLFSNKNIKKKNYEPNLFKLNNLELKNVDNKKFPLVNIIKKIPAKDTLFETVIVSVNDVLVNLFLEKKIKYNDIIHRMFKIINNKEFIKFKKKYPKNVSDIIKLSKYVRLKVLEKVYKT